MTDTFKKEVSPSWFGDFLREQRESQKISRRQLLKKAEELNIPDDIPKKLNETMFRRLERGESKQFNLHNPAHLKFLQEVYDADIPLLYAAKPEAVSPYVKFSRKKGQKNHYSVEFEPIEDAKNWTIRYSMADTRLEGAPQAIVWLEIKSGGRSNRHFHDGFEIVVVMKGKIVFELTKERDIPHRIPLEQGDILQFKSDYQHVAINEETETAEMLIIRSYAYEPEDD